VLRRGVGRGGQRRGDRGRGEVARDVRRRLVGAVGRFLGAGVGLCVRASAGGGLGGLVCVALV